MIPADVRWTQYVDGNGTRRQWWDDATRTYREYDAAGVETLARPYTAQENTHADQRAADAQRAAVEAQLEADTSTDLTNLRASIDALALLLGDNATAGSIRAWKAPITNNATLTGAQAKALADLLIDAVQQERKIARQVLRLAKNMVGDYTDADVGSES